jgi:nucleotide-binding universal stress UspA family protein
MSDPEEDKVSFATLMVHVEIEPHAPRRVEIAVDLAERFHAGLIGVAGWAPHPAFAAEGVVIDAELTARELADMRTRLAEAEAAFRLAAKPLRNVEWRGALEMPIDIVLREARAADLLILGRAQRSADWYRSLDVGGTLLRAGRPVLVVPPDIDRLSARRIVVAWKDTRESRRAVADALPFLRAAEEVMLLQVCERSQEADKRLADVTTYLVRHRVAVGAKTCLPVKGTVAAKILSFAGDEKADLLVAGGYGHSRLGEWIFGGVTKEVIEKSPICCLLSH